MLTDPGRLDTYGKAEDLKGKHMLYLVGLGLIVGSLIAISITSGMLAITIIMLLKGVIRGPLLPLEPTFIALGVEGLILVIGIVMWWYFGSWSWWPFY